MFRGRRKRPRGAFRDEMRRGVYLNETCKDDSDIWKSFLCEFFEGKERDGVGWERGYHRQARAMYHRSEVRLA
jgi:hypothetical protein